MNHEERLETMLALLWQVAYDRALLHDVCHEGKMRDVVSRAMLNLNHSLYLGEGDTIFSRPQPRDEIIVLDRVNLMELEYPTENTLFHNTAGNSVILILSGEYGSGYLGEQLLLGALLWDAHRQSQPEGVDPRAVAWLDMFYALTCKYAGLSQLLHELAKKEGGLILTPTDLRTGFGKVAEIEVAGRFQQLRAFTTTYRTLLTRREGEIEVTLVPKALEEADLL